MFAQNDRFTLGSTIKKERLSRDLSQAKLAQIVGIDRTYLSRIENGSGNVNISFETAISVLRALDMKIFVGK